MYATHFDVVRVRTMHVGAMIHVLCAFARHVCVMYKYVLYVYSINFYAVNVSVWFAYVVYVDVIHTDVMYI